MKKNILQNIKYVVGIDGGANNGYCIFDRTINKITKLKTLNFWKLIQNLDEDFFDNENININDCVFIVEDPNQINPNFQFKKKFGTRVIGNISIFDRISQNVGMNKRTTQLIAEYISNKDGIVILSKPEKSKIDKDKFLFVCQNLNILDNEKMDEYSFSQHAIDSFMLIYRNLRVKK